MVCRGVRGVLGVFWGCFRWVLSMCEGLRAKSAILDVILAVLKARGEAFWGHLGSGTSIFAGFADGF
jgi:hypothetical protein